MCIYLIAIKYVTTKMKKKIGCSANCLDQWFSTPGDFIPVGPHLETFLVVTTGGQVPLASSGIEARTAAYLQMHRAAPPHPITKNYWGPNVSSAEVEILSCASRTLSVLKLGRKDLWTLKLKWSK